MSSAVRAGEAATAPAAWGPFARLLHWLMALMLLGMLGLGTYMAGLPDSAFETKFALYQWHKSFGLTLFALAILRGAWRLTRPVPPLPAHMPGWMRVASKLSHGALYAVMLLMPVTGYIMASASTLGIPTVYFGLVTVPHLVPTDGAIEDVFRSVHGWLGTLFMALITLHVTAALKHHYIDGDDVLRRMLPWSRPRA